MSKSRTTIYLEDNIKKKFEVYKLQDGVNLSELVNTLLQEHLDNPFNWDAEILNQYFKMGE